MYKRGKKKNGIGRRLKIGAAGIAAVVILLGITLLPDTVYALEQEETQSITVEKNALPDDADTMEDAEQTAEAGQEASVSEANLSAFTNTLEALPMYGSKVNTYLNRTDNGWQAVLVNGEINIIDFDEDWNQISERTLEYELPIFGAYYSGETYNYLVYGQNGSSEGTEIYRVVKYDKEFNRLATLSVPYEDCYTVIPFDAGNVSVAENGNEMVVYTSRERPDGHQSNIALRINTDTMTISNRYGMIAFPDIHVSHSFREIVKYDGETPIYVDLGDGNPRAVCLQEQPGSYTNMLDVPGEYGDNFTNTDVSGLAITDTGYLVVGTQERNYCNNIYLSYAEKGERTAKVTWLTGSTTYNYSNVCNSKIAKVSDGKYAVMWNNFDSGGSVDYVMVNDQGEIISGLKRVQGIELTSCEPVLDEGKLIWLKYYAGERTVCALSDFSCTGSYEIQDPYVEPVDPWQGDEDTSWYSEERTEFTLDSPEQLAGLAQLVNDGNTFEGKTIRLGKDLFFNEVDSAQYAWTPIASEDSGVEFEGTFDGQGHSVYNMYIPEGAGGGLFGIIGENGVVKAVRVSQSYILERAAVALVNNGWLLFCENNSYIDNYIEWTGGVCSENNSLVYGCGNTGVVQSVLGDAGGVVGRSREAGASVDSCWNEGYVACGSGKAAGVIGDNYGWVYDCYNAGSVSGHVWYNYAKTVSGVVGENHTRMSGEKAHITNCYNAGYLGINPDENYYLSDAVCGGSYPDCGNVYTTYTEYTFNSGAEIVTAEELKKPEMVKKLLGSGVIAKWQEGREDVNKGLVVPAARMDMENGVYKMLPDVWGPVTEFNIKLSDTGYQLKALSNAYYGLENAVPIYRSDSDILTVTEDGVVTPEKEGSAIVHVIFKESEHAKETSFDITVNISGMKGDVDGNGKVDIADLRFVLRAVCGKVELTDAQTSVADVETDGKVDIQDLRKILRFVCGKIEKL